MGAMSALDTLRDHVTPETSQEVAPPLPEEAAGAQMSTEGAIPAVGEPEAATEVGATASEQAFGAKPTAPSGELIAGMYQPHEYQAACQAAGLPDRWNDKYVHGHTDAKQWVQPYEGRYDMAFELKPGYSASQAVKDFLAGPTIGDFFVLQVADQIDELRDQLGDQRFDELFGSADVGTDRGISAGQRLKISSAMYTIPFVAQMMELANGTDAGKADEPEEPAVAAGVEQTPYQGGVTAEPAPEMIAAELGVQREQELV